MLEKQIWIIKRHLKVCSIRSWISMGCLKSHERKKDGTLSTDGIKRDLAKEEHFGWKDRLGLSIVI